MSVGTEIAAVISAEDLEHDVRWLSGEDPPPGAPSDPTIASRNLEHPDLLRAHDALYDAFVAIPGLVVTDEPFAVTSVPGALPGTANLIADLPAAGEDADPAAPRLVIGAHYDSIASFDEDWTSPSTQPAPGADDDASGVAVVLAIARTFAGYEPGFDRPVRFVLFSGEEYGLLGSFAHVDGLDGSGVAVDAMIQLDPVGHDPGDVAWLWVTHDEQSLGLSDDFLASVDASGAVFGQVNPIDAENIGGDDRSDHFPFWDAGIPALHVSSFPQPAEYHTMGDTIDVVDPTYTREVAVAVGTFAADRLGPRSSAEDGPRACGCATRPAPSAWTLLLGLASLGAAQRGTGRRIVRTSQVPASVPSAAAKPSA